MGEERKTEGWSGRQLIKQLQSSVGSHQSTVISPQSTVHSRQFEAPSSIGNHQYSVGSHQSAVISPQSTVHSRQFEAPSSVGNHQYSVGSQQSAVGSQQSAVGSPQSAVGSQQSVVGSPQSAARHKDSGKKGKGGIFKGLISGTIISESLILKDIRYTGLVALLAIIFIANKFNAEAVERQIIVLEQEVRDMRAESLSVSAELGSVSRQSEITELVKERGLGLEELREPPYRIVVNE